MIDENVHTREEFEWTTLLRQWRNSSVKRKTGKINDVCQSSESSSRLRRSSLISSSSSVILVSVPSLVLWVTLLGICILSLSHGAGAEVAESSSGSSSNSRTSNHVFSNQFAVHIPSGDERANEIAAKHGWKNLGQIGSLPNHYLYEHERIHKRSLEISHDHHELLKDEPDVHWFEQQVEKKRVKRDFSYFEGPSGTGGPFFSTAHSFLPPSTYQTIQNVFLDPLYKEQWYLTGGSKDGFDMNVLAAWKRGYTGKGVVVSILDDGIQPNHPDLLLNYDPRASTDINDNDLDPTPQDNGDNKHGTRCAGEVAAQAGNNICGVGVAYNASIGGVRMLDGTVNDAVEAKALGLNPDHIDIYSASWGPEDDGKTVDGPGPLARRAFIYGVTNGRRGLGSIFVWASGNGGRHVDSCNCDGYTNSIFTLSISSATQGGYKPWYLEECASTLATTYSSGTPTLDKSVATVDMDGRLRPDHICTVEHTGTSASAPLAAGMVALALEANRNLSWRDLQHLVVMTSRADPLDKEDGWYVNGVSRKYSHKFGYGLMDAGALVDLAVNWVSVPPQHICKSREIREDREIPGAHLGKVKVFMDVDGCAGTNSEIRFLEHVQCKISLRFFPRGNLRILLTSPMGTSSVLLFERPRDVASSNFDDWPFLSVHFWGEQAHGRWTLEIINSGSRRINQPGIVKKWQLILYGTDVNPIRIRARNLQQPNSPHQQEPRVAQSQNKPQQQYHDGTPSLSPRTFVPREYLYPGASENVPQIQKTQNTRSQCQNEYWVPDLTICVNDCPEGYFGDLDRKECLPCQTRCKSCYNSTSCAACEHNLVLFGTSCLPICPEGYYEADSSCELCQSETCAACAGAMGTECVTCKDGLVLHENNCMDKCPPGTRVTSYNYCTPCTVGCQACDENKCLECSPGYQLSPDGSSFCVEINPPCPVGLFYNSETSQCEGCGRPECLHCLGTSSCIECKEGYYVHNGGCVTRCWDGLYPAANSKECFDCPKLCTKCSSEEACTECRGDGMLQDGKCIPHCLDGYFNDMGICTQCSPGCKTCIGKSDTDCVTCNSGYSYLKGGTCVQSNTLIKDRSPGTYCPVGTWPNPRDSSCIPCHSSCSRCSGGGASNCRACVAPLRLDRGTSRCIDCCQNPEEQDCCHCESIHHSEHTQTVLTSEYNAECHVVARRVSESDENGIDGDGTSHGKWSDSSVLTLMCGIVFLAVVIVSVFIQRRRRRFQNEFFADVDSDFDPRGKQSAYHMNGKSGNHHKSLLYAPVNLDEDGLSLNGHEIDRRERQSRFEDDDYDDEEDLMNDGSPEETPLVLKT